MRLSLKSGDMWLNTSHTNAAIQAEAQWKTKASLCICFDKCLYIFFQFHHRHASILKATSSVTYATFYWNTRSEIIWENWQLSQTHRHKNTHQNIVCGCSCCAVSLLKWCVLKANIVPAGTNALIPTLNANKVPFPCNFSPSTTWSFIQHSHFSQDAHQANVEANKWTNHE